MGLSPTANSREESRNLPLNTPTKLETNRRRHGFSGYTPATPPVSSRVIGKLQTMSRSLTGGILRRIYSSSFTTGCGTRRTESGFLSSTTPMILVTFSKVRPRARRRRQAGYMTDLRNHSRSTCLRARMVRFSSRPGLEASHRSW
jgi:hypothetical protein